MNRKTILIFGILVLIIATIIGGVWVFQKNNQGCIAVIVPMRNIETGECKNFPSSCDTPKSGWTEDDSCMESEGIDALQWKIYNNEEYGFEISYPSDFIEKEAYGQLFSAEMQGEGSSYFFNVRMRENHQVEGDIIFQNKTANKYYYREGAGYSGVFQVQLDEDTLEISYDMIGGKNQEFFVETNFNKIISTIKLE
ncbi:MAG: hypothetical protein ABIC36_02640 [bacterium]